MFHRDAPFTRGQLDREIAGNLVHDRLAPVWNRWPKLVEDRTLLIVALAQCSSNWPHPIATRIVADAIHELLGARGLRGGLTLRRQADRPIGATGDTHHRRRRRSRCRINESKVDGVARGV